MTSKTSNKAIVKADPNLPTIRVIREFDAPRDRVYRAFTDPELVARWLGPREYPVKIGSWDARTGGHYRYSSRAAADEPGFYGSFHELRKDERIVQTFCYEGFPDGVALETLTFTELPNGRTRLESLSVLDTIEGRDGLVASGMEQGMAEGYEQLDELLAEG